MDTDSTPVNDSTQPDLPAETSGLRELRLESPGTSAELVAPMIISLPPLFLAALDHWIFLARYWIFLFHPKSSTVIVAVIVNRLVLASMYDYDESVPASRPTKLRHRDLPRVRH